MEMGKAVLGAMGWHGNGSPDDVDAMAGESADAGRLTRAAW